MKAFTRLRSSKTDAPAPSAVSPQADEVTDAPVDPSDDFLERLGDLDRFIGGAATQPVTWPSTPPTRNLFTRPDAATPTPTPTPTPPAAHDSDEAEDFLERLGDLDRFIGGTPARDVGSTPGTPASAPPPPAPAAEASPAAHDPNEADDFLERLGDLDRFIGGPGTPPPAQR